MSPFERTDSIAARRASAWQILAVFVATVFLSAFLLFSVQPFFAKMVLPRLGGSPGVWSVAMVFFQSALLLGYGYAHLVTKHLDLRHTLLLHGLVLVSAFVCLPVALPQGWDVPPETGQSIWLLALFAIAVGPPFFAVSTTAPLIQAWFVRTDHPHAADPYFLYGASNIGSFASLFLFIALFEPWFTVSEQSWMWTAGYATLTVMVMACGAIAAKSVPASKRRLAAADKPAEAAVRPGTLEVLRWIGLAFIPSGLLVAVTAHISTDVAAAPLFWVIPLALFLLTFVFAFMREPMIGAATLARFIPVTAAAMLVVFYADTKVPIWLVLPTNLLVFFIAALTCHSLLASHRPPAANLTSFYMWMSLGGVLGGVFSSLVAPAAFDWTAEYPLLTLAFLLCLPPLYRSGRPSLAIHLGVGVAIAAAIYLVHRTGWMPPLKDNGYLTVLIIAIAVTAAFIQLRWQSVLLVLAAGTVPLVLINQEVKNGVYADRSFFGIVRVTETRDGRYRKLLHGTTLHGAMAIRDRRGRPVTGRPAPLTYYHRSGAIAVSLRVLQEARGGSIGHGGVVGLGTGSLLCHTRPGERWTVYEIDKSVIDAATNPALFRFVSECAPDVDMVLGDARIMLAREAAATFDYLLIDAFSSDAIPVHLLTREAVRMYMDKLADDGLLALHISNRYLEIESLIAAIARDEGLAIRETRLAGPRDDPDSGMIRGPQVVVLAKSEKALGAIGTDRRWRIPEAGDTRAWTDDYSDILSAMLRKYR